MAQQEPPSPGRAVVVGAGISGLVTAKALAQDGFDVELYDKMPAIGGVWEPSRSYPGLRTNSPREFYEFSDFPYASDVSDFPTADEVRRYIDAYVDHFGLGPRIHCSTEVLSVQRRDGGDAHSGGRFRVTVRSTDGRREERSVQADFVAICNGVFSEPYTPSIEGSERFSGRILHSSDLTDTELVRDRRVLVVGSGKSALDCATVAAEHGSSCTLLYRTPRWMIPRYLMGLRYDYLFFNRMAESLQEYHRKRGFEAILHGPLKPFLRLYWRFQSWLIRLMAGMPRDLVPEQPLPSGLENLGVGTDFYEAVNQGRAVVRRDRIRAFSGDTEIRLESGDAIEADVVILATGWKQRLDFLEAGLRSVAADEQGFRLYRHIVPPEEPKLGFVGYASTIANTLTSEISAHWLSDVFLGNVTLPSTEAMHEEISTVRRWAAETFPVAREGYFIGPFIAHHVDDLMRDMGLSTRRTSNVFAEYFARFLPRRYRDVTEERRARPRD